MGWSVKDGENKNTEKVSNQRICKEMWYGNQKRYKQGN